MSTIKQLNEPDQINTTQQVGCAAHSSKYLFVAFKNK